MMVRGVSLPLALLCGVLLFPATGVAQGDKIKPQTLKGNLGGKEEVITYRNGGLFKGFLSRIPIRLEAEQSLTISVTMTGKDRIAFLVVLDPTGKPIAHTGPREQKSAVLPVEEVSASGRYTIVVGSDRVGLFELKTAPLSEEEDEATIKQKIKDLEKEIERLKKLLKERQGSPNT